MRATQRGRIAARGLVLGGAVVAAFAVGSILPPSPADADLTLIAATHAAEPAAPDRARSSKGESPITAPASPAPTAPPAAAAPPATTPSEAPKAEAPAGAEKGARIGIEVNEKGVVVRSDTGHKKVHMRGLSGDKDYDSFESFMQDGGGWIPGLVFFTVTLVFLVPVLIVALLIWYRIHRNRMLNDAMLKLAEKGVMPPAQAMESLAGGAAATGQMPPGAMPLYEQARQLRKRAAWSDLRKAVVLMAVGLGLSFFSMLDDGTPNSIGLICLFLGIGYCVLWYFEDRHASPGTREAGGPPAGSA